MSSVIVGTAQNALGQEMARDLPAAALLEVLSNPWDGSGLTLSEKIHGASNTMLNDVITTVRKQIHLNKTVKDTAQALYDGYRNGHVVRQQELPKYMDELTRWTRRSRENLSEAEVKDLQRAIRKVRAQAEGLVDDSSTYNHFRTALNSLFDKLDQGSEKATEKALQAAIEEKSRYVAERIARTEAARARYDAFIARYGEDDSVVAYRWKLGSRHPAEDICDMYAHADLYGLGAGVFPKDEAPVNPAHPHCLCHYAPVYASELKGKKRSDNVEGRGNAWLKRQPLHIRQAILGVKGEQEWKAGRAGWMEKARNLIKREITSRLNNVIIQADRFHSIADPMVEVLGPAEISSPRELRRYKKIIRILGVKIVYHSSEQIGYAPGLTSGKPGQLHITKGASISAWRHEMRHVIDDYKAGWSGFLVLADKEERIRREIRGYNEELKLARKLNRPDIVNRLEALRENEIKTLRSKNSQE